MSKETTDESFGHAQLSPHVPLWTTSPTTNRQRAQEGPIMQTTALTLPGSPLTYTRALRKAVKALQETEPAAAQLLQDLAQSIDQAGRTKRALQKLRDFHKPEGRAWSKRLYCSGCFERWPCRTARQLDGLHPLP